MRENGLSACNASVASACFFLSVDTHWVFVDHGDMGLTDTTSYSCCIILFVQ